MLRVIKSAPREDGDADPGGPHDAVAAAKLDQAARAALGGDRVALRSFLGGVAPIVRRVCRGVMGRDNPELEDAIQDCLIDVARALPQFRFDGNVSHYVVKIAMRRAIASRQRSRTQSMQHASLDVSSLPAAAADGAPDARAELVQHLLENLDEAQAKALLLRVMLGHSIDEIASMTGVSVNTVKTRLRLGKEQLRRWLRRTGEGGRADG
jgi:RNA polymerase sigma factor (sigma-70 family)